MSSWLRLVILAGIVSLSVAEMCPRDIDGIDITQAPTTEAPTTQAPTTEAPTTQAPKTEAPTTQAPTTEAPTTKAPKTEAPTTKAPTTEAPTTQAPKTEAPTTKAPTTEAPTTQAPKTEAPTTKAPTTEAPTTQAPKTEAPTTKAPTTEAPTTQAPKTEAPTTQAPTTKAPTTEAPTLVSATSCANLKELGVEAKDGEYDLYPSALNGKSVKVYCHEMAKKPKEYITLPYYNGGNHPNKGNKNCRGEAASPVPKKSGSIKFNKIRIDIDTMVVKTNDYTFTEKTGKRSHFGQASDCYSIHYGNKKTPCGIKGSFVINTGGTGLIVDPNVTWKKSGWNSFMEMSKSQTGETIQLLCGGWCGKCKPAGSLRLVAAPTITSTAKPKLCADVRESDRDAQDGDYTLYPDSLGGQSATFYCHDMANNPREFVSLSVPNKGEHPDIGNLNCIGETKSPIPSSSGTSSFTKVRVHMKDLDVDCTDYTFATTTGRPLPFGEASDCYSIHYGGKKSPCGIKGKFTINTTGTSFSVNPAVSDVTGVMARSLIVL